MSFWPDVYNRIINQEKIFEYRRTFPKQCTKVYMYVSSPIKAICGILYFDNIYKLDTFLGQYNKEVDKRIISYSDKYRFTGTIKAIQKIKPISLDELRLNVPGFTAPQSYLYIENFPSLENYINENVVTDGKIITNNLDNIFPDFLCL